jgi:hypothetical protein
MTRAADVAGTPMRTDWNEIMRLRIAVAPLTCSICGASPCINPSFCAACQIADRQAPRRRSLQAQRPTPRSTVEAILHCVRERGPAALQEPANIERLSRCDAAALAEIDARLAKLGGHGR